MKRLHSRARSERTFWHLPFTACWLLTTVACGNDAGSGTSTFVTDPGSNNSSAGVGNGGSTASAGAASGGSGSIFMGSGGGSASFDPGLPAGGDGDGDGFGEGGGVGPGEGDGAGAGDAAVDAGGDQPSATDDAGAPAPEVPAAVPPPNPQQPPQGALTAGVFDDNLSFPFFEHYRARSVAEQFPGALSFTRDDHTAAHDFVALQAHETLDLSLVIDTTGSMGDEIQYLQNELATLSSEIADLYPNAEQRWSLIVYRDVGDDYVTQATDFTDDLDAFRSELAQHAAGGGGDFPEAPDAALAEAATLAWRSGNSVARLLFWVADAPHHDEKAQEMAAAIEAAQQLDVHIYPVASSGIDPFTEYTMRSAAQLTGGRYLFLTDDSGIGGGHLEPTVPCAYVTTLSDAILRSVAAEMTGEITPPSDEQLIRLMGTLNTEGNCFVGDGYQATPF